MRKALTLIVLTLTLAATGCGTVAKEDRDLVATAAAVGAGDLKDWPKLSDDQKRRAHYKLTRAFYILDAHLNDAKMPKEFEGKEPAK